RPASTRMFVVVLALAASAVLAAQQRDPRPGETTGGLSIAGRIVALGTGEPLPRAVFTLASPSLSKPRATRTGIDGRYAFAGLPNGTFTITASKPQYLKLEFGQRRPFEPGRQVALTGTSLTGVDISLPRAAAISGTVVDERGEAVDLMWVFAFRRV